MDDFLDLFLGRSQRQVIESLSFTDALAAIGPIQRLDEALGAVQLILTENAEVYPVVSGFDKIRIAKTRAVDDVPALNVWYVIEEMEVILLFVEPVPDE